MNRSRMTRIVAATSILFGALVASGSGCVEAEARFYAQDFCPGPNSEGVVECTDQTVASYNVSTACIDDSCLAEGATIYIKVVNRLSPSLDSAANHNDVETSDILLSGYDVRLNTGSGEEEYAYNVTGLVPVEGEAVFGIQLLPLGAEGTQILQSIDEGGEAVAGWAGVRVYGRTTGGLEVETPEAFVPVNFLP